MIPNYTTYSWESGATAHDDGYVDEVAALIEAIAANHLAAIRQARDGVGVRRWPMQPIVAKPRGLIETNGRLSRRPVDSVVTRVFERDSYRCRYCGTRTIPLAVLAAAQRAGLQHADVLPCHSNWRRAETDPVFYWQSSTLEHVLPVARGGSVSEESNLVTACWPCQARKGVYLLDELGWELRPIPQRDWTGLCELLGPLRRAQAIDTEVASILQPGSVSTADTGDVAAPESGPQWVTVSFHATSDGRDGALVAAAVIDNARATSLTSRGALRTTTSSGGDVTLDGRWRARRATTAELEGVGRRNHDETPWVLEVRVMGQDARR